MKKKLVVLTGAGISAESGLKTFRDNDGLWEGYKIEEVATPTAWKKNAGLVLEFYNWRRAEALKAEPNQAHKGLVELEEWYDVHIITQNVDTLHERAGSKNVIHLHGNLFEMKSEKNDNLIYPILKDIALGDLATDGAQLRPNIVWFGESVDKMDSAIKCISNADAVVIVGTSLVVYPAAGLINYAPTETPIYLLDKKIPKVNNRNTINIEMPATEGIKVLKEKLKEILE